MSRLRPGLLEHAREVSAALHRERVLGGPLGSSLFRSLPPDERDRLSSLRDRLPAERAPESPVDRRSSPRAVAEVAPVEPPPAAQEDAGRVDAEARAESTPAPETPAVEAPAPTADQMRATLRRVMREQLRVELVTTTRDVGPALVDQELRGGATFRARTSSRPHYFAPSEVIACVVVPDFGREVRRQLGATAGRRVRLSLLGGQVVAGCAASLRRSHFVLRDAEHSGRPLRYVEIVSVQEDEP
jgi:hypothetical protein